MIAKLFATLILASASGLSPAAADTLSAGDPARGAKLFLQCAACHVVQPGAPSTVGPNLAGVVGAKAGGRPGYIYSPALTRSGLVWNTATLDTFLKRPMQAVPGTRMAFAGIADARARADIIAYLTTLKSRK